MIPMLIVFVVKRMKTSSFLFRKFNDLKKLAIKFKVLLLFLMVSFSYGTENTNANFVIYKVVRNGEIIGTIQIACSGENDSNTYALESNIEAKCILKFNISGKETSKYKDGVLVYSSVFRTVNNKVKANQTIVYKNGNYQLDVANKVESLNFNEIHQNLVILYFKEPKQLTSIFCDIQKEMVTIEPLGNSTYKVDFSNGKYNIFHYKNGKCVKIEANSTLFNVTLIPA